METKTATELQAVKALVMVALVMVARAPAGAPETKEIMMVHVKSIILSSEYYCKYAYYAAMLAYIIYRRRRW